MNETTEKTNLSRAAFLVQQKSLPDLVGDLRKAQAWLLIAAIAAFLASSFFVVKYFAGGEMTPETWTAEQWLNAFLGLGITAVITAAQAFLYQSGFKGHAAAIATFVVVFFGVFSEVSQSMEREDATVRERSTNSQVFQAALGSINQLTHTASSMTPQQERLAEARAHLDYWVDLKAQKQDDAQSSRYSMRTIERNLVEYQRQVDLLQQQVAMQADNRKSALSSAIAQAKALEYDEDKHYAMIRLIGDFLGVTAIWASFIFSIIIIGTFEYAFHFVGTYVADHKAALMLVGRDTQGNAIRTAAAALQAEQASDQGTKLRDEYLDWVSPERRHAASVPDTQTNSSKVDLSKQPRNAEWPAAKAQGDNVHDLTQKRFYKLIYTEVRNMILNGEIKPTIRPVTEAVTDIIKRKADLLGIKASMMGKPQRQHIAESILAGLEQETIVERNTQGGVGKPKYVLADKYAQAVQQKLQQAEPA